MNKPLQIISVLSLSIGLYGCGIKFNSSGPHLQNEDAPGVRYYLPQDFITLTSVIKDKNVRQLSFNKKTPIETDSRDFSVCYSPVEKQTDKKLDSFEIQVETIADHSTFYTIGITPRWFSEGEIVVSRNDSGLLTGVTLDSEGQVDEIAIDLVKTVASVAGAAAGIPTVFPKTDKAVKNLDQSSEETCGYRVAKESEELGGETFLSLSNEQQFAVLTDPVTKKYWQSLRLELGLLEKLREKDRGIITEITNVDVEKTIDDLVKKEATITAQINGVIGSIERIEGKFKAQATKVSKNFKLSEKDREKEYQVSKPIDFWLSEDDGIYKKEFKKLGYNFSLTKIGDIPENYEKEFASEIANLVKEEFTKIREEATTDAEAEAQGREFSESISKQISTKISTIRDNIEAKNKTQGNVQSDNEGGIFYRDKTPFFYVIADNDDKEILKFGVMELFDPSTEPGFVQYRESTTGDRKLELRFGKEEKDANGQTVNTYALNYVGLTYSSSGKAISAALSQSVDAGLDAYDTSYSKAVGINDKKRKEELAQIQHSVSVLEKRKEDLIAEIELESAEGNTELIRNFNDLQYNIDVLKRKKEYLEAGFGVESVSATYQLDLKNDLLQSQIEVLKNQIDVLKQRNALEELRKEIDSNK